MNKKRIIFGILIVVWMFTIFIFSSENGQESTQTSDVITTKMVNKEEIKQNTIKSVVVNENSITEEEKEIVDKKTEKEYKEKKDEVSYIVRKTAHFIIYMIGGILVFNFTKTFTNNNIKCIVMSIAFCFIYSISDELHQYFVSERSAEIKDVILDTIGASIGGISNAYIIKVKKSLKKSILTY